MGGETSKRSGEIGELLAKKLLELMGWSPSIQNISITCNNSKHLNEENKQRSSHGEDRIFIYNSPFHDDLTHIVHISVKNEKGCPPSETTLKKKFKNHLKDLQEIIECSKNSPKLSSILKSFRPKRNITHSGLLVWFHNDQDYLEYNIKPTLANSIIDKSITYPMSLIDNARAAFILKTIDDIYRKNGNSEIEFYYPPIGTSIKPDENPTGNFLPLEVIASDIISHISKENNETSLTFYADQKFTEAAYIRLMSYALDFSRGLVSDLRIGMPNFSVSEHEDEQASARMHFSTRKERITPFSYNRSILNFLEEEV